MPEWNNLKRWWLQGAWLGLADYLYRLPLVLIILGGMAAFFVGLVLSAVPAESARSGAGSPLPWILVLGILAATMALALAYGLVLGLLRPAILAEYVQRGTLQACFDFGALGVLPGGTWANTGRCGWWRRRWAGSSPCR